MASLITKTKCKDLKGRHKKFVYDCSKSPFIELGDLTESLKRLYPTASFSREDKVCPACYKIFLDEVENIPLSSTSSSQQSSEEFIPSEAVIDQLNQTSSNLKLNISPIKMPQSINIKMRKFYVTRKRKQMNDAFDSQIARKITKLYDITDLPTLNESNECKTCDKWLENIKVALDNCSNFLEKVRLLSLIPNDISKEYLLSVLPNVTVYLIDQARSLVNNKDVYKQPEKYCGHSLDNQIITKVKDYYLNDDFNCSRQSANKSDTISVKENGTKTKKIKRFLTRSIKEIYKLFIKENPEMKTKIGKSTFYALRPKWVIPHPPTDSCLCVYCENLILMLDALNTYKKENRHDIADLELKIYSSLFCSKDDMKCVLRECKECPIGDSIDLEVISLTEEDLDEEITYGIWEKSDLLNKTSTIEDFLNELRQHALTVSAHKMIKEFQRVAIKEVKLLVKESHSQLVMHVDFAENWTVLLQNEIQSYHWGKKQLSIFTSVCYFGNDKTVSYVIVSDDIKHDSSHALMAMDLIINSLKQEHIAQELDEIITISDGAASHFKNRYQFYELKNSNISRKWLFSATGHGKGACDGIGGLVKHYATTHNLSKKSVDCIRNAEDFATHVSTYTPSINILVIRKDQLEAFRQIKKMEWLENAKEIKGIQKIHCWKSEQNQIYTARTSKHEWQEVN